MVSSRSGGMVGDFPFFLKKFNFSFFFFFGVGGGEEGGRRAALQLPDRAGRPHIPPPPHPSSPSFHPLPAFFFFLGENRISKQEFGCQREILPFAVDFSSPCFATHLGEGRTPCSQLAKSSCDALPRQQTFSWFFSVACQRLLFAARSPFSPKTADLSLGM